MKSCLPGQDRKTKLSVAEVNLLFSVEVSLQLMSEGKKKKKRTPPRYLFDKTEMGGWIFLTESASEPDRFTLIVLVWSSPTGKSHGKVAGYVVG